MSPLRKLLRHPGTYLAILALLGAAAYADSLRSPDRQLTSRVYINLVRSYQSVGSPILALFVQCRYRPPAPATPSKPFSATGFRRGVALTAARLWRCRGSVPLGTADPVP